MTIAVRRVPQCSIRGSRVLITGGSAGIGLEMAKEFVRRGAFVVIAARREDVLRAAIAEITAEVNNELLPRAKHLVLDVRAEAPAMERAVAQAAELLGGPVDILVCCAGFSYPSRFLDCPEKIARDMMEVNYFGSVNVVRAVLPGMLQRREGRIVLVSSMAAAAPVAGFTNYAPTKAALRAFAQSLDMEVSCLGVNVQVINPPDVATPGYEEENKVKSPECKAICSLGGASPFTAREMARRAVDGVQHYSFQVNMGFDGHVLGMGSACMEPPSSVLDLAGQFFLLGVVRVVGAIYSKIHYNIVKRVRAREDEGEVRRQ
jgi:3-dehydrosphinganine reductase